MNRAVLSLSLVVLALPSAAEAQRINQRVASPRQLTGDTVRSGSRAGDRATARTIVGTGTMVLGGIAGGYMGYGLETVLAGENCYDMCGFGGMLLGATVGGLLGTAIGVTYAVRSQCSASSRFGRALGGAVLGAIAGGASAAALQNAPVLATPVGVVAPALVASLMLKNC